MMLPPLPRVKGKEDAAAGASAVATICELCDLYTRNDLDGKWTELAAVYDQRRNVDNFREILDLSAPDARMGDLNGWHLERMAVGEFDAGAGASASDLAEIKRETRMIKQTLMKVMASGRSFKAKRGEIEAAMAKQREALTVELTEAKEFLGQAHLLNACDSAAVEVSEPAPVEERLRATVKHPELSPTVDLSEAPSI
ncbi:hypothetical protein PF010_g8970 [Phytophthora fragariae]|nr:hypothetical protein PF003_g23129 [Phytophthora fragariae]KAE8939374.1 hypothetical protein PF009_g10791 [Phytophthora fragariae]KAE9013296.1 hypothetical protein PF011_g8548 [Phytophthora fragariae]KAE9116425.1 hypothetical protein PF010_g8970 [Phytophthora fragariae]KAE9128349.1 hypothetical protein PF007_g5296 [Phytophthora fragariae]